MRIHCLPCCRCVLCISEMNMTILYDFLNIETFTIPLNMFELRSKHPFTDNTKYSPKITLLFWKCFDNFLVFWPMNVSSSLLSIFHENIDKACKFKEDIVQINEFSKSYECLWSAFFCETLYIVMVRTATEPHHFLQDANLVHGLCSN